MRTSSTLSTLLLVAGLGVTGGAAASAEEPSAPTGHAPVTAPDTIDIFGVQQLGIFNAGQAYVLSNDSAPDGDPLEICGVANPDEDAITVTSLVRRVGADLVPYLLVTAVQNRTATHTVTYQACDGQSQTPGTLTVNVTRIKPVKVTVPERGGLLTFTNRGTDDLDVDFGKPSSSTFDGVSATRSRRVTLAPGSTRIVGVKRPTVAYSAVYTDGLVAGSGTVDVPERSPRTGPRTGPAQN